METRGCDGLEASAGAAPAGGVSCLIRTPAEVTDYRYSRLQPLPTTGLLRARQHFTSAPPGQLQARRRGRARFVLQSGRFKGCIIKRDSEGPDGGSDLRKVTALAEIQRAPLWCSRDTRPAVEYGARTAPAHCPRCPIQTLPKSVRVKLA